MSQKNKENGPQILHSREIVLSLPESSLELGDVNVTKPPPAVSIDLQIETAETDMKELVDNRSSFCPGKNGAQ